MMFSRLFVFSYFFLVFCRPVHAETVDRIVAIVNTEVITDSDQRSFSKKLKQNSMIDELLLFGKPAESIKNDSKEQLNYLINERILASEIKRLNLSVTIERVEQEIRDIAKRNGVSRSDLLGAIRNQGLTVSEYQDFIKTRVERQSLIESEITSKIRVSDEDILAAFARTNPKSEAGIYEYTLANIFFSPKKAGGSGSAKERAERVLSKIRGGENYESLAEQNSEDPNFTSGGLLGTFKAGELNKEMEAAVKNLSAGEVSDVVTTKSGVYILKVLGKKVIADPRLDKEKERIRSELFDKAFQKHFKAWLEQKRDESFVRINSQ